MDQECRLPQGEGQARICALARLEGRLVPHSPSRPRAASSHSRWRRVRAPVRRRDARLQAMPAAAVLLVEIHVNNSASLKHKRSVVKHLLASARQRYAVAAAEVGAQDVWQRAELGFAALGASAAHVEDVLDAVERFVWSHPELEVLGTSRHWTELEA